MILYRGTTEYELDTKKDIIEHLWKVIISDNSVKDKKPFEESWTNVFGNNFEGARSDQSRYVGSMERRNELPFELERISHIDVNSEMLTKVNKINIYNNRNIITPLITNVIYKNIEKKMTFFV